MATPAKNFTSIPDSDIDADSPLTETLMTQLRDNDNHLEEWLGKNYTAAVDHDHDGVNSKAVVLSPVTFFQHYTSTEHTTTSAVYGTVLTYSFYVQAAGKHTFHFEARLKDSGPDGKARLNIDSTDQICEITSNSGSYTKFNANGTVSTELTVGWHVLEIELRTTSGGASIFMQGFTIAMQNAA